MTNDKAREYFSAFQEGVLEPGLRASLERKLHEDASLQAEYEAFATTLESLSALRTERIEIPTYLDDRISARLEATRNVATAPFWAAWMTPFRATQGPRYVYALGLATALLVAAVGLRGMKSERALKADLISSGSEAVRWTAEGGDVVARIAGGGARRVTVTPEGGTTQDYEVATGQPLELTLRNPNPGSRRFTLRDGETLTVAVPGLRPMALGAGSGTVSELASALADAYRVTVVVKGTPIGATVRWKFEGTDARLAAEHSLGGRGNASMMADNVLLIGQ